MWASTSVEAGNAAPVTVVRMASVDDDTDMCHTIVPACRFNDCGAVSVLPSAFSHEYETDE
jgi:hypothetical protein